MRNTVSAARTGSSRQRWEKSTYTSVETRVLKGKVLIQVLLCSIKDIFIIIVLRVEAYWTIPHRVLYHVFHLIRENNKSKGRIPEKCT